MACRFWPDLFDVQAERSTNDTDRNLNVELTRPSTISPARSPTSVSSKQRGSFWLSSRRHRVPACLSNSQR